MCLDKMDKKTKKVRVGWKLFEQFGNGRIGPWYALPSTEWEDSTGKKGFDTNCWIQDPNTYHLETTENWYTNGGYQRGYQTGFHFFLTKKEARRYMATCHINSGSGGLTVRKVKVRKVVATGHLSYCQTGVAREMFITNEKL